MPYIPGLRLHCLSLRGDQRLTLAISPDMPRDAVAADVKANVGSKEAEVYGKVPGRVGFIVDF